MFSSKLSGLTFHFVRHERFLKAMEKRKHSHNNVRKTKELTHCHVWDSSIHPLVLPLWPWLVVSTSIPSLAGSAPKACSAAAAPQRDRGTAPERCRVIEVFYFGVTDLSFPSVIHGISLMKHNTGCLGNVARLFFQNN